MMRPHGSAFAPMPMPMPTPMLTLAQRATCAVCVACLALTGCSDKTALIVEVTSPDLSVPADVDALELHATSADGTMADFTTALSGPFPHSLAIYPGTASTASELTITVTGTKASAIVVRRVVRARFVPGESRYVTVELTGACVGILCAPGVDCVAGACAFPIVDGGMPPDGGRDGGAVDGGSIDGGAVDGGAIDGGARDGGPDGGFDGGFDGGSCTPTGLEVCGGGDEDCDGKIDETLPCPGSLAISEVATGGPLGGSDELVEIYNRTPYPIRLDGVQLQYRSATGASYSTRATYPAASTVAAHGFYLLGSMTYSRSPASDPGGGWTTGFAASGGHVRLLNATTEIDRFGWGTATAPEGSPMPAVSDDTTQTYERKARATSTAASMAAGGADVTAGNGLDTDNNASDFVARAAAEPQSSASPPETP